MRRATLLGMLGMAIALAVGMAIGVIPVPFASTMRGDDAPDAMCEGSLDGADPPSDAPAYLASAPGAAAYDATTPGPVDLDRADRDLDLHGVVLTTDGRPVVGARLSTVIHPGRRGGLLGADAYDRTEVRARTRTAVDGSFSIRLSRGACVALRVEAAGFATRERAHCHAGQRVRWVVGTAVTCVVSVRDETGTPLRDVPVRLWCPDNESFEVLDRVARTGVDGVATFSDLPGASWAYVDPRSPRCLGARPRRVALPETGEVRVEAVLAPGRTIRGKVVDAQGGSAVAGVRVFPSWAPERYVVTDVEGRYELPGWSESLRGLRLFAQTDGYAPAFLQVEDEEVVDFSLERGDTVTGRVVDAAGTPLEGILVGCVDFAKEARGQVGDAGGLVETGPDGRFRRAGLLHDTAHALVFLGAGLARTLLDVGPRPGDAGLVDVGDVVLRPGRRIEGRVLDADGRPLVGAAVRLVGANADRARLLPGPTFGSAPPQGQEETVETDDLGRFRFSFLAAGTYTVSAVLTSGELPPQRVELGTDADVLDLELRADVGREVVVRVMDSQGAPLPMASVSASRHLAQGASGTTDGGGAARLRLGRGRFRVRVTWDSALDARGRVLLQRDDVVVSDPDVECELRLEEARPASGVVRSPGGEPMPWVHLSAVSPGRRTVWGWADREGRFSIPLVVGVPYRLLVTEATEGRGIVDVEELYGERADVRAGDVDVAVVARPLARDRRLSLLVLGPDAVPLPGIHVSLANDGWCQEAVTDGGGRVEVEGICARPVHVRVAPDPAHASLWAPVARGGIVPADQTLVLRLGPGVAVTGRVLGADGRGVGGAHVDARGAGADGTSPAWWGETDEVGRFRLLVDQETPLPLILRAFADGYDATERVVPRLDGTEIALELEVP